MPLVPLAAGTKDVASDPKPVPRKDVAMDIEPMFTPAPSVATEASPSDALVAEPKTGMDIGSYLHNICIFSVYPY